MSVVVISRSPVVAGGTFTPPVADTHDLGSTTFEWDDLYLGDDGGMYLGIDQDVAIYMNNAGVAADTALASGDGEDILVGTPVTPIVAVNSLIVSNVFASGDILVAANRGGNSEAYIFIDASAGVMYLTPVFGGLMVGLAADAPAPDNANFAVWGGDAGSITADATSFFDVESAGNTFVTILMPDLNDAGFLIASPTDGNTRAYLIYEGDNDLWKFQVNQNNVLKITGTTFDFQQATTISTTTGDLTLNPTGDIMFFSTLNGVNVSLVLDTGEYGNSGILEWREGNSFRYRQMYDGGNNYLHLVSFDSDGSGTDADIWRIDDGQTTIDANTTWDINVFDSYDDVALIRAAINPAAEAYDFGKGVMKRGREALIEVGVLKQYYLPDGSLDETFLGYNDQRMAALLAGGIYQTRAKVDEQAEIIRKLQERVKELGRK